MKNKRFFYLGIFLVLILFLALIVFLSKNKNGSDNRIIVTTSFYPIYFLTSQIGGDLVDVINLTPSGTEPHDYEPTARDIVRIRKSEILILNGGGLEVWGDEIKKSVKNNLSVIVLGDELIKDELNDDEGGMKDPHIWLSPVLAVKMAEKITSELGKIDSKNYDYYKSNLNTLKTRLFELDNEYRLGLSNCKKKDFVTSHSAFGYLANEYNLKQLSIAGISPEEEPSSKQLAQVAQFARENEVKYIFFESLINPRLSEVVADEIGAKTLVLNPIEGLIEQDIALGKSYITEMRANLDNLKIALECD